MSLVQGRIRYNFAYKPRNGGDHSKISRLYPGSSHNLTVPKIFLQEAHSYG